MAALLTALGSSFGSSAAAGAAGGAAAGSAAGAGGLAAASGIGGGLAGASGIGGGLAEASGIGDGLVDAGTSAGLPMSDLLGKVEIPPLQSMSGTQSLFHQLGNELVNTGLNSVKQDFNKDIGGDPNEPFNPLAKLYSPFSRPKRTWDSDNPSKGQR